MEENKSPATEPVLGYKDLEILMATRHSFRIIVLQESMKMKKSPVEWMKAYVSPKVIMVGLGVSEPELEGAIQNFETSVGSLARLVDTGEVVK